MMRVRFFLAVALAAAASVVPATSGADNGAVVVRFPVEATVENCTGELVTFSGTVHFVVQGQFETPSGTLHLHAAESWQDMSGTDESGNLYRLQNAGSGNQQQSGTGTSPTTLTQNFHVISQSSLDNFFIHTVVHLTAANGEVVVVHEDFVVECRG